jgi:hypothetical protein
MTLGVLGIASYSMSCLLKPKIDVGEKTAALRNPIRYWSDLKILAGVYG